MLKDVRTKKILKEFLFPLFTFLNKFVPKKENIVLLYSANGGICHSLVPLRDYLLDNGYQNKYRIYCGIEDMKYAEELNDVRFISHMRSFFLFFKAKYVFYTTGQIPIKPSKLQTVIQLGHGITDFKTGGKLTKINNGDEFFFSYILVSSELYIPIYAEEYECGIELVKPLGDILADQLLKCSREKRLFVEYDKLLVWFPTYRKSDYLGHDDSNVESLVPMFNEADYVDLNEHLRKKNIKLVVKTHPAQTNVGSGQRHFSNLDIYTHDEFLKEGLDVYSLFAQADGMIGDYSSMSLHALLIDIPLAFVVPDLEEYSQKRGFVFKDPTDYMCGEIINTQKDFYSFLDNFVEGKDSYKSKRHKVKDIIFKYQDGQTCRRAVELSGMCIS